ncbi:MAG: RtcB family protein [Defluviitaleaceae bacterium]|nr:RtcB family protein [Defluviitaleaceae bacterium]
MKIIQTEGLVIKNWCEDIEESALEQAVNLAKWPHAFKHIALMPDAHFGFGMPIGGILASKDHIIPNAVGMDIGCGVLAVKTRLNTITTEEIKQILSKIRKNIPLGFNHRKTPLELTPPPKDAIISTQQYKKATYQVGTLGGGNHFIEIQKGSDGHIWFMLHSGSRNIGATVATHYNQVAKDVNIAAGDAHHPKVGLAYLHINSKEAKSYIADMTYCQSFAKHNRKIMADYIVNAFEDAMGQGIELKRHDVHHNFAALEEHFGERVWVHRKGATSAQKGEVGLIPGSQGTKSYIVIGKGNPDSFNSCSHGAGRKMGRKEAQRSLSLEKEIEILNKKGIVHALRGKRDLDEATSAYKDIDEVINAQRDLVDVDVELLPLGVIKA